MNLNLMTAEEATFLQEKIANARHIVIVGHSRPDGDAIGSCLAWSTYLSEQFGKESVIVVPNAFPDFLHWLQTISFLLLMNNIILFPKILVVLLLEYGNLK